MGISRHDIRNEVEAGRWQIHGRRTVQVGELTPLGRYWMAVFETGAHAALDGAARLVAEGMTGFTPRFIDVTAARGHRPSTQQWPGVRVHQHRDRGEIETSPDGLPCVALARAGVNAGIWAASDREAATVICMSVQQRIVDAVALREQWHAHRSGHRAEFLDLLVTMVNDGVQALSELDFARECRDRGLPEPSRQSLRQLPGRRAFLDAEFDEYGFAVEIDGSHHFQVGQSVSDLLRQNEVVIGGTPVLRVPVLGYHLHRAAFMDQVERFLTARGWRRAS